MSLYNFIATDFKLPISNKEEKTIQSVNDLVKLGYAKKDIHKEFDNILKGMDIDDDEKIFLFDGKESENKLEIYGDSYNQFARYYSQKKNIYRIENENNESFSIMILDFLNTIKMNYKEIELWHTWLDNYELDEVEFERIGSSELTVDKLDVFFDKYTYLNPKVLIVSK